MWKKTAPKRFQAEVWDAASEFASILARMYSVNLASSDERTQRVLMNIKAYARLRDRLRIICKRYRVRDPKLEEGG